MYMYTILQLSKILKPSFPFHLTCVAGKTSGRYLGYMNLCGVNQVVCNSVLLMV